MPKIPNLVRREGTYYVRVKVPKDLVPVLGKRELKRSLNTKDAKHAHREYQRVYGALLLIIAEARNRLAPSIGPLPDEELQAIVRDWFSTAWKKCEDGFQKAEPPEQNGMSYDEIIGYAEMAVDSLSKPDVETNAGLITDAARLLKQRGHGTPDKADLEKLASYIRHGLAFINRAIVEHYRDGKFHHPIDDPLFSTGGEAGRADTPAARMPSVGDMIKRFKADPQRQGLSPKNLPGYEMSFRLVREVAGQDIPITAVRREHAKEIVEILSTLPANATKKFPGKPLREVARLAKERGLAPMQATTARKILLNLRSFFSWASDELEIDHRPFRNLNPLQPKKSKHDSRAPWPAAALVAFFSSPEYQAYKDTHPARYWVPLIGIYHGARTNEICQIRPTDVITEDGVAAFRIGRGQDGSGMKRVKTDSGERLIPIHPRLVDLGFSDFVDRQRRKGATLLFPEVRPGAFGYRSDTFSNWFTRFRRKLGLTDGRYVFHSFRHNFNDACREADIPGDIVSELAGWAKKSMRERYGRGYPPARKRDEIAKVSYSCLDGVLNAATLRLVAPSASAATAAV